MRRTLFTMLVLVTLAGCDDPGSTRSARSPFRETATSAPTSSEAGGFDPAAVNLQLEPQVDGLSSPLGFVSAEDGSGRMFVVEQGGLIRTVVDGDLSPEPFLDLSDLTEGGGEQGLLGLAFHPDFPSDRRLFVNYTDNNGDTVVASYESSDGESADLSSGEVLLQIDQPFSNHNGGHLAFGPDGYLYIATGDGGGAGDPEGNGQRLDTLLGKLLRIDVDRGNPYGIPRDNPFVRDESSRPEIWAYGLRNPWRFSFDGPTGTLWVGDVGQGELEEIDRVGIDEAGLDFGWNEMEGSECFAGECDPSGRVLPVTEYSHDEGCSVTGGFVYRGKANPDLIGAYLFADFCSGALWAIDSDTRGPLEPHLLLRNNNAISSFGRDEMGELFVTDIGSGEVLRLVDAG